MRPMQLSPNFSLAELVYSETAEERGIDNKPPPEIVDPGNVARFCDVAGLNYLAVTGWTAEALHWLRAELHTPSLAAGDVLKLLRDPADQDAAFYSWLVSWADGLRRLRRSEFAGLLGQHRCVRTTSGDWVAPSSGVFFPRERAGVSLEVDMPVTIADLPSVVGLPDLLAAALQDRDALLALGDLVAREKSRYVRLDRDIEAHGGGLEARLGLLELVPRGLKLVLDVRQTLLIGELIAAGATLQ